MDKKNRIILTVIAVMTLFVALVGATFAYFSATSTSEPQVITTSSLSLSVNLKGSTHITNIKPTTWTNIAGAEINEDISKIPFAVSTTAGVKGVYNINLKATIPTNSALIGGSASDVKYKLFKDGEVNVLKEGSLSSNFSDDVVINAPITEGVALNDNYVLYIYIENKSEAQNTLQGIDMSISLTGEADQID